MIIPSLDLLGGRAVQLVGGKPGPGSLDLGDPLALAARLAVAGELAVVDLDAALGTGDNEAVVTELLRRHPARVGGGIRSVEKAVRLLDAGATKVILGTAARPELLTQLPRERCIAALDELDGRVVTHGWTERTARTVEEGMRELAPFVSGFLVTTVEREGRERGLDPNLVARLAPSRGLDLTVAGGVCSADDVRLADQHGLKAQVGMALHTGRLHLADALAAPLTSDRRDGLWPTIVVDLRGAVLGLAYSNAESLRKAVELQRGVYWSRERGLWVKGLESGDTQDLLRIDVDCDRDTLRFTVRQHGRGFCHEGTATCFGPLEGLAAADQTIRGRLKRAPPGSYTRRLLDDPALLQAKLVEEARELALATGPEHAEEELADVLYFALVRLAQAGGTLEGVSRVLDRRALRVTRRPGDAKE